MIDIPPCVILAQLATLPMTLRLYRNDYTPVGGCELEDFEELSGGGYTPCHLHPDDWKIDEDDLVACHLEQCWTFLGPAGTVYGYYVTSPGWDKVIMAERFAEPFEVKTHGDEVAVIPRMAYRGSDQ